MWHCFQIITRDDGTIEMTETFYHYGDGEGLIVWLIRCFAG